MLDASFPSSVLVVDDEEVVADLLSKVLTRQGIAHVTVGTGREALSLLERERFGALISDKNLPDISGVEVLRAARRLQPYCACLMITGYASTESVLEVLRMGAADYIEKPFPDVKLLVQRIQAAMAHQRADFERDTLVDALRSMQRALEEKSARAFQLQTERELLESVVDLRIEERTGELLRRAEALEAERRADRELDRLVLQKLDGAIEYMSGITVDETVTPMVRGVFRELGKRLDEPAALMRDRVDPQAPTSRDHGEEVG